MTLSELEDCSVGPPQKTFGGSSCGHHDASFEAALLPLVAKRKTPRE